MNILYGTAANGKEMRLRYTITVFNNDKIILEKLGINLIGNPMWFHCKTFRGYDATDRIAKYAYIKYGVEFPLEYWYLEKDMKEKMRWKKNDRLTSY